MLQSQNEVRLIRAQKTIKKFFVLAFFISKSSRNSLNTPSDKSEETSIARENLRGWD